MVEFQGQYRTFLSHFVGAFNAMLCSNKTIIRIIRISLGVSINMGLHNLVLNAFISEQILDRLCEAEWSVIMQEIKSLLDDESLKSR